MRDIYNYVLETTRVSLMYSVAAVLHLTFLLHVMLFRPEIRFVLLHEHFPQYVCNAQYDRFFKVLNFIFS